MTILNFYQISKLIKNSLQSTLRYTSQLSASALNVTYRTIIIMNYIEMMHMNHLGHYWPKWIILQSWEFISARKIGYTCFYCLFLTFSNILTSGFLALCFLCLQKQYSTDVLKGTLFSHTFKQMMHYFPSYSCYSAHMCT